MNNTELWNKIKGFPLSDKQKRDLLKIVSNGKSDNDNNEDNNNDNDNDNNKRIYLILSIVGCYKDINCTQPIPYTYGYETDSYGIFNVEDIFGIDTLPINDIDAMLNIFKNFYYGYSVQEDDKILYQIINFNNFIVGVEKSAWGENRDNDYSIQLLNGDFNMILYYYINDKKVLIPNIPNNEEPK